MGGDRGPDIDLEDPEVQDAALKIQAGFKGMKARQEVKSLKVLLNVNSWADPGGLEGQGSGPPLENYKAIDLLRSTCQDTLENHKANSVSLNSVSLVDRW